jgi:hypothetical protein
MDAESWSMADGLHMAYTHCGKDVVYLLPSQNNIATTARCDILHTAVPRCGTCYPARFHYDQMLYHHRTIAISALAR